MEDLKVVPKRCTQFCEPPDCLQGDAILHYLAIIVRRLFPQSEEQHNGAS